MVKEKLDDKCNAILLANYFLGYNLIYPSIAAIIDKFMPNWELGLYIFIYSLTFLINIILLLPVFKNDLKIFSENYKKRLKNIVKFLLLNFTLEIIVSILIFTIFPIESANEKEVEEFLKQYFVFGSILSVIFAPIVEESVFRVGILKKLEDKIGYKKALIISSFLFGLIHVITALLDKDFGQLIYIVYYAFIGMVAGLLYKRNGEIISPIIFHSLNNLVALLVSL